jgi:hypothetical protein
MLVYQHQKERNMTKKEDVLKVLGFLSNVRETRSYPYYGDRFTAYRRGTSSDYQKARTAYIKRYGLRSWQRDIKPLVRKDRMKLFWEKPSRKRLYFVNRLAWSSEQRVKESGKLGKIVQRGFK